MILRRKEISKRRDIIDELVKDISEETISKIYNRYQATQDFDIFCRKWVDRYELPEEVYRGLTIMMNSYLLSFE